MAKEALAAFEATKAKEPNRFQGYAGAAKAADMLGDQAAARHNYQQLVALTASADMERTEITEAKKYLASPTGSENGGAMRRVAGIAVAGASLGCVLAAAFRCRSCGTRRYKPPVHLIKLTKKREITPYVWVHPNDER